MRLERLRSVAGYILLYIYYGFVVGLPSFQFFAETDYEQLFNSMLVHLLAGRFDVDTDAVGMEGFVSGNRSFSYFGVFPALLRLPLLAVDGWETINLTHISLLLASCISATLLIRTAIALRATLAPSPRRELVFACLIAAIAFGGVEVPFLKPNIYQEVVAWGFVFAAWFVRLAVLGLLIRQEWTTRILACMGIAAGVGLLTRVSVGIGLYAALGLLLIDIAFRQGPNRRLVGLLAFPAAAMAVALVIVGIINQGRWGNPFTFADFRLYRLTASPLLIEDAFSLARLWSAFLYYFIPIWGLPHGEDSLLLAGTYQNDFYGMEHPPASFLLTDPILLWLGVLAIRQLWLDRWQDGIRPRLAILLGLAIPCLLMLTAAMLAFRYRVEFYPLMLMLAFLGAPHAAQRRAATPDIAHGLPRALVLSSICVSLLASHVSLLLYRVSDFGTVEGTFAEYYAPPLQALLITLRDSFGG